MNHSSSKINSPSKSRSTSNIINNIHTMSWLKKDLSSSENSKTRNQTIGKDGEIISMKKTNEDYFSGTKREEKKKIKKKKDKKGKSGVVIANLQDLVSLTQQNEKRLTSVKETNEILIENQTIVDKEAEIKSEINIITKSNGSTVWTNTSDTADKLFPNVQSVRIDRAEEEEMLSIAIAESIATVQLEQFKRPSPDKENKWEALYGDFEDEGSWDNVKRNLPTEPETTNSGEEASSGQQKSRDDNNNSSKSGILRNRQGNVNRYLTAAQEHDFCFKTSSENSKDELEKAQSLKSVSFNESVAVNIRSSESSESDKSDKIINENKKGPNIDKYGRVDGYSERRLFMGKGARIREQEYIQNQSSLGVKNKDLESESKATLITKTQEHLNVQVQKIIPKSEKTTVNNSEETPETRSQKSNSQTTAIVRTQKPAPKSGPNSKNPKSETRLQKFESKSKATVIVKNEKPALNTLINTSHCPRNVQSQKSRAPNFKNVKNNPRTPGTSREIKRDERSKRNVEKPNKSVEKSPRNRPALDIASNTTNFGSSNNQKLDSHEKKQKAVNATEIEPSSYEISSPTQREKIVEIKDGKDLLRDIVSEEMDSDSGGPCLVPTLVRQDGYTPNLFTSNFQDAESIAAMSEVESQSPACQNLILAGVSCQDAKRDVQSFMLRYSDPTNFQYQNYSIPDSVSLLQSQSFNNAYSTLPNYANMNETDSTYFTHRISAENLPYQNVSLRPDPDQRSNSNFAERVEETGLPNINTEYLEPITDLHEALAHERKDNDSRLFLTTQGPPGFINNSRLPSGLIRNLQLPSGFTKRESNRRCDTEEINLAVTQKARVAESEKVESDVKKSLAQNRPGFHSKNWKPVQTNGKPSTKHQNSHKLQTANSDQEKSLITQNRKVPYPILGANQHSDDKNSDLERVESKTSQSSDSLRDAVNNQSPNTRENSRKPSLNNNNYMFSSTQSINSDLNLQEMNDSQSGVPVMCQMPDRLPSGSSNVSNWQYNVNIINSPQVQMNLSPYYQMAMQNPHDLPANILSDYFHGFHQLPMHAYSMQQLMNTGEIDTRNMKLDNSGSPEIEDSALNRDSLMQESIIGDNYSLDETTVGQLVPNSNFYETQTMPIVANAWNMQNNQTDNNVGKIFDNFNAGRGRGRLEPKNNF